MRSPADSPGAPAVPSRSPATRDFIDLSHFETEELLDILDLALRVKKGLVPGQPLAGRSLAMIFRKSSTRTRVSAEVGMFQLGGHAVMISDRDSQIGRDEGIEDTARVLSRYVDAILIRTFAHDEVVRLAEAATVPVINGLTDLLHPCQVLADLLTIAEEFGEDRLREEPESLFVAWIGDGNNMAHSWLNAAGRLGFNLRIYCPMRYAPDRDIVSKAETYAAMTHSNVSGRASRPLWLCSSPAAAAHRAHVVTTDVWASMGQEDEAEDRARVFRRCQVTEALMSKARPESIFLHCLPAHRGEEVAAEVIDGPRSRVWRQAENRLHAIKAVLLYLLGEA